MTNARAYDILKRMKKAFCFVLTVCLILALSAGLFACKEKEKTNPKTDVNALATLAVETSLGEERADKEEIAAALIALLNSASLEEAETVSALTGLINQGAAAAQVLIDLKAESFVLDHIKSYRDVLQTVASSVSPEVAGRIFYAAASKNKTDLPYSLSDCEKLAALVLGQDAAFGTDLLNKLMNGDLDVINEKQVNTFMITIASALRTAAGVSTGARAYFYTLVERLFDEMPQEGISQETVTVIQNGKGTLLALAAVFRDGYDVILNAVADYLSSADAKLFLGFPYAREERTVYYGYTYETWTRTIITKEQFDAREGDFDEFISMDATVKGFIIDGVFTPITDEDADLADSVYRLSTLYAAYNAMTAENKAAFKQTLHDFLTVLNGDQGSVAAILDKPLIDDNGIAGISFDEFMSALPALSGFDMTDGISQAERTAANNAITALTSYLHGYLPRVY